MAKKKAAPAVPEDILVRYPIKVIDRTYTDVTRERDPEDEWSSADLSHHTDISCIMPGNEMDGFAVPFQLEAGKEYYLVYVTYRTGDSFHHEDGCVEYIDLFATRERAEACAKAIEEHHRMSEQANRWVSKPVKPPKDYSEWTVPYLDELGIPATAHACWHGYFERLQGVTVERVVSRFNQDDEIPEDGGLIRYRY